MKTQLFFNNTPITTIFKITFTANSMDVFKFKIFSTLYECLFKKPRTITYLTVN